MKKSFFKRLLGHKTKTGASLLVVLVSVTLLIVMGTTFSFIAMSAYNNSQRRLCQQQAYYTAEACLNILSTQFASDPTGQYMDKIVKMIKDEYELHKDKYPNVSDVVVTIAKLEDKDGNNGVTHIPSNGFELSLLGITGGCIVTANAVEGTKNVEQIGQIRLVSTGIYKGFSQSVSARMAITTNGALELKKVFSNSQSWCSPIVTLIAGETTGDMYFASPGKYERWPNGEIKMTKANENLRDNVYGNVASGNVNNNGTKVHTRPFGIDNKPLKLPSTRCVSLEYIDDLYLELKTYDYDAGGVGSGHWTNEEEKKKVVINSINARIKNDVINSLNAKDPGNNVNYANFYYKESDHGKFLGPNGEKIIYRTQGHWHAVGSGWDDIKENEFVFVNSYLPTDRWYNDWVEIYMFTGQSGKGMPNIVDGDMYVNTQALIGLYDKDDTQVKYWPYRDVVSHRDKVERKYVSYAGNNFDESFPYYADIYRNGYDMGPNFEHGGEPNTDLFFDYNKTPPAYNQSTLSHNGNMYLFEDARIECYDSTHTPNANKGVKNNIFAHKNLVIDGAAMKKDMTEVNNPINTADDWTKTGPKFINYRYNNLITERNVNIFGDVMVEGDLMISNAVIYGDVFVNGDNLYISDSEIYGNVYFNGAHMITDGARIRGDEKTKLVKNDAKDVEGNPTHYTAGEKPLINAQTGKALASGEGFSFQTDEDKVIQLKGGDLIVLGNGLDVANNLKDKRKTYDNAEELSNTLAFKSQEQRFKAQRDERDDWGVRLTNTSVHGTLFSEINVAINTMFRSVQDYRDADGVLHYTSNTTSRHRNVDGDTVEDVYGNIVVSACLLFDLREKYRHDIHWADATYLAALQNNAVRVTGICMSERMQIVQTQAGDDKNDIKKLTRYEKGKFVGGEYNGEDWVKGSSKLSTSTALADYGTHKEYSPNYLVDRRTRIEDSRYYRCANVQIQSVCVGDGGLYVDGTQWYYQHSGGKKHSWYAQYQDNAKKHTGIIIDEIYCISTMDNTYGWADGNYQTASKIAVYNVGGKPHKNDDYFDNCVVTTPIATTTRFRGKEGPVTFVQKDVAEIRKTIYNQMYDLIDADQKARVSGTSTYQLKAKGSDLGTMDAIMGVLREYYMLDKAPHRINAYYSFMAESMNYRGYKPLTDIRTWANSVDGRGPYQRYDPDARDGVWRQIKVLQWRTPDNITAMSLKDSSTTEKNETHIAPLSVPVGDGVADVFSIDKIPNIDKYITRDPDGTLVVTGHIKTDKPLYVPANQKIIFDSSNGNLHCQLNGGLVLEDGAELIIRGGGMTFLYVMNKDDMVVGQPNNPNNLILYLGRGAKLGTVQGNQGVDKALDSLYVVSNDAISLIQMKHAASVNGYVYTPNAYLRIDEYEVIKDKKVPYGSQAENSPSKVSTVNTVVHGSMIVKSFLVDMTMSYDDIFTMYKNLKYEYVMAPLICDSHLQLDDGNKNNEYYNNPNWGFIGYD